MALKHPWDLAELKAAGIGAIYRLTSNLLSSFQCIKVQFPICLEPTNWSLMLSILALFSITITLKAILLNKTSAHTPPILSAIF